ncbi:amino acid permease [Croceicoccus naphthovorans]|uniref:Amino acid permease n=1 Tax=Croceicoccus naphthovorans TaxID=1348774 RepID=A0A0G3XFR6_9SPHN|nr:amino acid permease [Croceicoccus naphthovorans]AKM09486.1 amino acid permease [Croceicoccus naphthovorans]MBB3991501.1 APA family basic amino acid/polyamine antiporter [Croceicoccus naphthovorans]
MAKGSGGPRIRKSLADIHVDIQSNGLKRSLGPVQLVLLGIGCIVGAGIYVMTGAAAANYAGPAVLLSFVLAGLACGFTGLCYAELASTLPVSGSSYSYTYASLGEVAAWTIGWLLMLEYGLAGSALAAGLSGYLSSLLSDFGVIIPEALRTPWITSTVGTGGLEFSSGNGINLVAAVCVALVALVLVRGVSESARVNAIIVVIKISVLILFVGVGAFYVVPDNWFPFIPESQGGFTYGEAGIFRGASILFFAYLGFETISTAALEARNPQRDMPIGIIGALIVCTILYMAVGLVLTGLVPYQQLGVPDPIALAVDQIGMPAFTLVIKLGAVLGLMSVLLVNTYGHTRICFAMSQDGLLPRLFSSVHTEWMTPHLGTVFVAIITAIAAATLPITILGDLVSLGTACAFSIVAITVMWLRTNEPDLERPFRVPLGGIWIKGVWIGTVPVLALVFCLTMVGPVVIDIGLKAAEGQPLPAIVLGIYFALGFLLYRQYGWHNSRLRKIAREAEQAPAGS